MKGKKMVFAVMLSLIVCLLLVPTCAYATEVKPVPENSDVVALPTVPDGDTSKVPAAPAVIGDLDGDDTAAAPDGGDDGDDELNPDTDEDESGEDSTMPGKDDDTEKETGSDEEGESKIPGDSDDDDEDDEDENENNDNKDKPANNGGGSDSVIPSDTTPSGNGGNTNKGFQVELTYNDKVVKKNGLKGGESFDLAELLHELGIDGELTEAKGNADDLFDAVKGEDGWKFNTKMAFGDPYELVVTVDGVQYVITVTDANLPAEVKNESELANAISSAYNGQVIKITNGFDVTGSYTIAEGKSITIDLNGQTLRYAHSHGKMLINKGTFTLQDSSNDKSGKIVNVETYSYILVNVGTAYINGGTIESSVGNRAITNLGTLEINDGFTLDLSGGSWDGIQNGRDGEELSSFVPVDPIKPVLTIKGGNFVSKGTASAIKNDDYGTLVVDGGTFNCKRYSIQNAGLKATINGGNFLNKNSKADIILGGNKNNPMNTGELVINGGNFESKTFVTYLGDCKEEHFDITVTGGTFSDTSVKRFVGNNLPYVEKDGKLYVNLKATSANTIAPDYDAPVFKYMVVEGKDQTWTKSGSESLNYVLNADANNLVKVLIDGEEVEFEIDENGEVVISAEVLEKLEAGEYEIEFIFADGSCKTKLFVK